jgi:sortase A
MTTRGLYLWWLERVLLAAALVCAGWTLIVSARTHFYSALPIPAGPPIVRQLPGDESDRSIASAVSTAADTEPKPGDWVARLEAPAVGPSATVLEGSTDDVLTRAAGHIENTALPGKPGNVGIAGHRDTTFRPLRGLGVGDVITLITGTGRFDYRISRTFVVRPDRVSVLDPTVKPSLTLVTCYPFTFIGNAPMRYILQAELLGRKDS